MFNNCCPWALTLMYTYIFLLICWNMFEAVEPMVPVINTDCAVDHRRTISWSQTIVESPNSPVCLRKYPILSPGPWSYDRLARPGTPPKIIMSLPIYTKGIALIIDSSSLLCKFFEWAARSMYPKMSAGTDPGWSVYPAAGISLFGETDYIHNTSVLVLAHVVRYSAALDLRN